MLATPEQQVATMTTLYAWRDARREYNRLLAESQREERWGGIRSIGLFAAISAVMVGLLVAGVAA